MDDLLKVLLIILIIVYIFSPVDIAPGPIDDILVTAAGIAKCKKLSE